MTVRAQEIEAMIRAFKETTGTGITLKDFMMAMKEDEKEAFLAALTAEGVVLADQQLNKTNIREELIRKLRDH